MMDITKSCREINELSPNAQKACNLFLKECKKRGLNVLITETYRPQERQNYLYEQGRTRPGQIVTWTKSSRHTSKRAWDICKNVKGNEYNDSTFFIQCGAIAAELGITWGGVWKSTPDTPHFEIENDWKEIITTPIEDKELSEAVSKIIKSGIQIQFNSWKRKDLIRINNTTALLCKLAKIELDGYVTKDQLTNAVINLKNKKIITSDNVWLNGTYTVSNIRDLLIKFSKTI